MISMTSWKNRLRRMLFLYELKSLVGQTQKVADFGSKSAIYSTRGPNCHGVQQMDNVGTVGARFAESCYWATVWKVR